MEKVLWRLAQYIKWAKIRYIIKGWSRYCLACFDMLPEEEKKEAARKIEICKGCPRLRKGICIECGCPVVQKSYSSKKCELYKW